MSENNTNVPKIRFPGFTDGWERHSLSNVGDFERISVDPQATPDKSFVEYSMPSYDNGRNPETIFGHSMQSMRIKISGDVLLINKLNVRQRRIWFVKDTPINAVASSEFMPFTSTKIDLAFLEQLMLSDKTTRDLESISSGTSNSQKRITPSDVLKYRIKLPVDRLEQEKIGSFFKNIDNLINLHQRKLKHLHDKKKSLLQKMFPKNGSNVPEIRFPGFTDAWEQRRLGELADIVRGASPRPIQDPKWFDENSDVGWLRIADVTEQDGRIHHIEQRISELGQEKTRVLTDPHLLLSIAATVGKPVVNYIKTGVHDGFLIFLNPKFDREFMFQWLEMFRPMWQKYGQPGSQVNLNSDLVKNQVIMLPTEEEQKEIGGFFSQLDNLITLHQRKLKHVQDLKKSLLQQMFV